MTTMQKAKLAAVAGFVLFACRTSSEPAPGNEESTAPPAAKAPAPAREATAKDAIDACRLLTNEEASAALAGAAKATPSNRLAYATSCIWEVASPRRGLVVMVSTPAQLLEDPALPKTEGDTVAGRFARVVELEAGAGAVPVPGLGNAALYSERRRQLWVAAEGRALLTVSFHGEPSLSEARERSQVVAQRMLARL